MTKNAIDKLRRYGFKPAHECLLTVYARYSLVHVPKFGPTPFAGLVQMERMHVYFIGYCSWATELLAQCVPRVHYPAVHAAVRLCHTFRDPITGATHPRLACVLKMTHLTAERRVRAIFYWAHVLGTTANVIVPGLRVTAQVAVATLQVLLIATRGHRAYTEKELKFIFVDVGTQFFKSLETMTSYLDGNRLASERARHERDPIKHKAPVPFKRCKRSVVIRLIVMYTRLIVMYCVYVYYVSFRHYGMTRICDLMSRMHDLSRIMRD